MQIIWGARPPVPPPPIPTGLLKAPITTAADDKFCQFFSYFLMKIRKIFLKKQQNLKLSSAANYRWRFMG